MPLLNGCLWLSGFCFNPFPTTTLSLINFFGFLKKLKTENFLKKLKIFEKKYFGWIFFFQNNLIKNVAIHTPVVHYTPPYPPKNELILNTCSN